MSYVVFDLDETLADLTLIYHFLMSLRIKEHILETQPYMIYFFPLEEQLDKAYARFVEQILKEELSASPLGILRPGLLPIMKQLATLKQKGAVKGVVIYSNNSHLPSLHFVKDIIELHTGPLFDDCIHWLHPSREDDKVNPFTMKSWSTLSRILHEGPTHAPAHVHPRHVYFFDDLNHIDLLNALKEQYYQVPAFHSFASVERISDIYAEALQHTNVPAYQLLIYVLDVFNVENSTARCNPAEGTLSSVVSTIRALIPSVTHQRPLVDHGIRMMEDMIRDVKRYRRPRKLRRYTRRERRSTIKKHGHK